MDDPAIPPDLYISCYRFLFRVTRPLSLPKYKGSTFHGGFGHALNHIGRRFRDFFYSPAAPTNGDERRALPKPFMLIPPLDEKTHYAAGDEMVCGLILFGQAIRHFMIAFAALESLGQELGLGRDAGRYRIFSVEQITQDGIVFLFDHDRWFPNPEPVRSREILALHQGDGDGVTLSLVTRLRLKNNNALVREPPPFSIFFDRLTGRINSLGALYGGGILMPPPQKSAMLRLAEKVRLDRSRTSARWSEWTRPPKAGKDEMSFGGLLGQIGYAGDLSPFIPWLALGQWTGVGGKTSFGLGHYRMEVVS